MEVFSRIVENPEIASQVLSSKEVMGRVGGQEPVLSKDELADFEQYIQTFASEVISVTNGAGTREELWNELHELDSGTPLRAVQNFLIDTPSKNLKYLDEECGTDFHQEIDDWIKDLESQKCLNTAVNGLYTYFLLDEETAQNFSNRFIHEVEPLSDDLLQIKKNPVDEILLARQTAMNFGQLWEDTLPPIVYTIKTLSEDDESDAAKIRNMSLGNLISEFRSDMSEYGHLCSIIETLNNEQRNGLLHGGTSGPRLLHTTQEIEIQYKESHNSSKIETHRMAYQRFSTRVVRAGVAIIALYCIIPLLLGRYIRSH